MGTGAGRVAKARAHNKRSRRRLHLHRGLDQISEDLLSNRQEEGPIDLDLPGLGQHYCVPCSRHFISDYVLRRHEKNKVHKRRVKLLKTEKAYSHKEAMAGVGKAVEDGPAICTS